MIHKSPVISVSQFLMELFHRPCWSKKQEVSIINQDFPSMSICLWEIIWQQVVRICKMTFSQLSAHFHSLKKKVLVPSISMYPVYYSNITDSCWKLLRVLFHDTSVQQAQSHFSDSHIRKHITQLLKSFSINKCTYYTNIYFTSPGSYRFWLVTIFRELTTQ
jgi:hypothetical protein